ncbi:MAG: BrnT family toxin [Rickettsiales bacterium]
MFPAGFEWDINKNEANKLKHGISFSAAIGIFDGFILEKDVLHLSGEMRIVSIGKIEGRIVTLIYTWRGVNRRIISARKPHTNEVRDYEKWNE